MEYSGCEIKFYNNNDNNWELTLNINKNGAISDRKMQIK